MIANDKAASFFDELELLLRTGTTPIEPALQLIAQHFQHYKWVGIYWLHGDTLELGPFVGAPTEHTRIAVGQGVCGIAVQTGTNQLVYDVRAVANYLACSTTTRSEIVVLLERDGKIVGQIDADGDQVGAFDKSDEALLCKVARALGYEAPFSDSEQSAR